MAVALDLSLPMSYLIRQAAAVLLPMRMQRTVAAAVPRWLARGELDKDEYVRYLSMLWHVYECISIL